MIWPVVGRGANFRWGWWASVSQITLFKKFYFITTKYVLISFVYIIKRLARVASDETLELKSIVLKLYVRESYATKFFRNCICRKKITTYFIMFFHCQKYMLHYVCDSAGACLRCWLVHNKV